MYYLSSTLEKAKNMHRQKITMSEESIIWIPYTTLRTLLHYKHMPAGWGSFGGSAGMYTEKKYDLYFPLFQLMFCHNLLGNYPI